MKIFLLSIIAAMTVIIFISHYGHENDIYECENNLMDYQIEITDSSTVIWDWGRKVGEIPYPGAPVLDSIINRDHR